MSTPIDPDKIVPSKATPPLGEGAETPKEPTGSFRSFMEGGGTQTNPLLEAGKNPQISPLDLAQGKVPAPGPTLETITQQAKMAQTTLGDINNQLNTPKLKLKQSQKYLLKNKLSSANAQINSASEKVGAPLQEASKPPAGAGPLQKFLSLVTTGQGQLNAAQDQLTNLSNKGDQLSPGDMLLVQIKLNKAQQQLEYSSVILSKAVDDLKMMMNIQL